MPVAQRSYHDGRFVNPSAPNEPSPWSFQSHACAVRWRRPAEDSSTTTGEGPGCAHRWTSETTSEQPEHPFSQQLPPARPVVVEPKQRLKSNRPFISGEALDTAEQRTTFGPRTILFPRSLTGC
jgi:hypothetical protein